MSGKSRLRGIDWGPAIIGATLLVAIPRYVAAFIQAEPDVMGIAISPLTGFGFGIVLEGGAYYVIDALFDARRRGLKYWWTLLVFAAMQLAIAPLIVAPPIVAHLRGQALSVVLARFDWVWATVVAVAPVLLIAGVALAHAMRPQTKGASSTSTSGRDTGTVQTDTVTSAGKSGKTKPAFVCRAVGCPKYGQAFDSQPAWAGHCGSKAHQAAVEAALDTDNAGSAGPSDNGSGQEASKGDWDEVAKALVEEGES